MTHDGGTGTGWSIRTLRERSDVPIERERVEVPRENFERIRDAVERGVGDWVLAIVVDDGRVLLVCNRWSDGWIPPGGKIDAGETPREAAEREVVEETGVEATVREPVVVVEQTYACGTDVDGFDEVECALAVLAATADDPTVADEPGLDGEGIGAARWFDDLPPELEYHDAVERGRSLLTGGADSR